MTREYDPVPVPEGSIISTDVKHEVLQEHIKTCDQCRDAVTTRPAKFGQPTKMCQEYLKLAAMLLCGFRMS